MQYSTVLLFAVLCSVIASLSADEFLNWGNVNLGCTVRCGAYWTCFYKDVRTGGDGTSCNQPSGCDCNSFADDDDELFGSFGKKVKKGVKLYNKGRKIYNTYKDLTSDDDQLFGNINLGCTVQCGGYWTCFYNDVRNGGDGTACNQPSGCDCNSFAHDDDDELFGSLGKKVKKGVKLYNKGRKVYQTYKGFTSDDDQLFGNINLGCTVQCGGYWTCFYNDVRNGGDGTSCNQPSGCDCNSFAHDDDDELFGSFGKKVKKGVKLYNKGRKIYNTYKDLTSDDDEKINWKRDWRILKKKAMEHIRRVNPGCTAQCGGYWYCFANDVRNGGDGTKCRQPSKCDCNHFADDDDERINFGKIARGAGKAYRTYNKGKKYYNTAKKAYGIYKKFRHDDDDEMVMRFPHPIVPRRPSPTFPRAPISLADDDEFLINWKKVNLQCTVNCARYWRCVYRGFRGSGDANSCEKPSGCNCSKFAN